METPEEQNELVTVSRFTDPIEAQMARSALEAGGIAVFMQGENANSLYPGALSTRLLVDKGDEAAAREVLDSPVTETSAQTDGESGNAS